jgi:hypothetical protein
MRDTIDMAREAGFMYPVSTDGYMGLAYDYRVGKETGGSLKAFEALVRADERAQPAPVQEPVAWRFTGIAGFKRFVTDAQYKAFLPEVRTWYEPFKCESCTTPPAAQRQWVGLSDEEYVHITDTVFHQGHGLVAYYLAIEAKLKEKNT